MAKYKRYDYDQMIMLPISLEDQLSPGTLEFAIHTLVETRMDLSCFDEKYNNDETCRFAYDPKILFKIVLFAYSERADRLPEDRASLSGERDLHGAFLWAEA